MNPRRSLGPINVHKILLHTILELKIAASTNSKTAFIYNGFDEWQKGQEIFQMHQKSTVLKLILILPVINALVL